MALLPPSICINDEVELCQRTLDEMTRVVKVLKSPKKSSYRRASRHLELQGRGRQIDELRTRIMSHTNTLHTLLEVAIIQIVLATPDFVVQRLKASLNNLPGELLEINSEIRQQHRLKVETQEIRWPSLPETPCNVARRSTNLASRGPLLEKISCWMNNILPSNDRSTRRRCCTRIFTRRPVMRVS